MESQTAAVSVPADAGSSSSSEAASEAQSAAHRIHAALAPRIAVINSPDVDDVLGPNNIDSFADLLKPFQESIGNLSVRTSQLETRQCRTFPLSFDHLDAFAPAETTSTAALFTPADLVEGQTSSQSVSPKGRPRHRSNYTRPEILLDAISARISSKSKALWESRSSDADQQKGLHHRKLSTYQAESGLAFAETEESDVNLGQYREVPISTLTPWFADTRDMVLHARSISYHETFGHPLAVILVVSSSSSDPMNAFASLFEASQAHAHETFNKRPYVDPLVFRYYVLLHDVSKSGTDLAESLALLDNVKKTYGLHCCLLSVNSAGSTSADGRLSTRSEGVSSIWQQALPSGGARPSGALESNEFGSPGRQTKHDKARSWHGEENDKEYGMLIDDDDVRRIKAFVRDFAAQSLIPFMERCVSLWNEQLAASRRGLTGRLLGAGRKFFGGSSRNTTQSQSTASFATLGYYPHTAIEAQTRRLADFAFMTRDYKLATSMYDLGRRDYANDKAIKYIAGANEMFGLSHLMIMLETRSPPIDVDSYLASAGSHYLSAPRQKGSALQLDSLRATLLYYEAYRAIDFYRPVPNALVRTANEGSSEAENDLEVVAAMLLEQAAIADLRQPGKPALRKCALHLVMAAHRYRTCGQKHLSLRCFQASAHFYNILRKASAKPTLGLDAEAYEKNEQDDERLADHIAATEDLPIRAWELINDHMEQEMAQQAFNDGKITQAAVHYAAILQRQADSFDAPSPDSAARHHSYLQGLLTCCKYLEGDLASVLEMHRMRQGIFLVDAAHCYVEVNVSAQRDDLPWRKLEERVLGHSVSSSYKTQNTAAVDESFWIHIGVRNPFNVPLQIGSLTVDLVDDTTGKVVDDETVDIEKLATVTLEPLEVRSASITVVSHAPRKFRCIAVRYRLADEIAMREEFNKPGRRLNDTKEQRCSLQRQYAPNETIAVIVHESKAILEASFADAPSRLGLGEEVKVIVNLVNAGKAPLHNAKVYLNRLDTLLEEDGGLQAAAAAVDVDNSLRRMDSIKVPLPDDSLGEGQSFAWPVLLRGSALGFTTLRALVVFKSGSGETLTSQLQHTMQVEPIIDLSIQAMPARTEALRYHLRLDAVNLLETEAEQKVVIDQLTFVGPSWAAVQDDKDVVLEPFQGIGVRERRSSTLYIANMGNADTSMSPPITSLDFTVSQLRSILTGRGTINSADIPRTLLNVSRLRTLAAKDRSISRFLLLARREYRLSLLAHEFPSLLASHREGDGREEEQLELVFPLYEPHEVDVIAHWRIVSGEQEQDKVEAQHRRGQAFIFGLHLGPLHDYFADLFTPTADKFTRTMYAQTEREKAAVWNDVRNSRLHAEEDPILVEFIVPENLSHNFEAGRLVFSVRLVVRNLSPFGARQVTLQLDNTSPTAGGAVATSVAASSSTSTTLPVYPSYVERLTLRTTVEPLARKVLEAKVSVAKPGRAHLAPVLERNTRVVDGQSVMKAQEFQRWEHCPHVVNITVSSAD